MPTGLLQAYITMLPRLLAERDLRMVNVVAVASGALKPEVAKKLLARLETAAEIQSIDDRPKTGDPWGLGVPVIEEATGG